MFRRTFGAALVVAGSLASLSLMPSVPEGTFVSTASAREVQARKPSATRTTRKLSVSIRIRGAARHRLATRSRGRQPVATPQIVTASPPPRPQGMMPTVTQNDAPPAGTPGRRDYSALTTASLAPPDALKETMRPALEAKARTLATGALATPKAAEPLPILLQPRSVTFDLERGTRTVVYGDDIVVQEPYDSGRARELARVSPEPK